MSYTDFVRRKLAAIPAVGIDPPDMLAGPMFPHQDALCRWAIRRGRAAVFADTGLGKTRIQLAWADAIHRETGHDVLILAPLAVAEQTVEEGAGIGVTVNHARTGDDVAHGINITNYERLHRFDAERFGAVVLDESSCIKHHDTKTLAMLLAAFRQTPYKLCATATPAPNDWTELGTHAEFLNVCTQAEMLSEYFVHDGGETQVWRLKGHAREEFWRWVASWGALVRSPADLGFDGSAYVLPPLNVAQHISETDAEAAEGMLFAMEASTLSERRAARKASMEHRVRDCAITVFESWGLPYVETGIRGSQKAARSGKSRAAAETIAVSERQPGAQSGVAESVFSRILPSESGSIQENNSGSQGIAECAAQKEVCGGSRLESETQGESKRLAILEPGQEASSETQEVRDFSGRIQRNDGAAEWPLCNLPPTRSGVSYGGSLPCNGEGSRAIVHAVQSRNRETEGQRRLDARGDQLPFDAWLIWCDLNAEQDALAAAFGDLAFSVYGSQTPEQKEDYIKRWLRRERPVMISKPSIMGFGINAQHCAHMAFVGVTDSFEAYYQAVRRCWRFGQKRRVEVHIFASHLEGAIIANLRRKEADALAMSESLAAQTGAAVRDAVLGSIHATNDYNATRAVKLPAFMRASV